jgi:DMSO/TMAO reductase YedYZ molybdopterin-dependent catalytic subunit
MVFVLAIQSQAQTTPTDLRIQGPSGTAITITPPEFGKLPHIEHRAKDHDGQEHTYTGVPLSSLLQRVAAPMSGQLRGKALASYLLVSATDGYKVVFALPELDSLFAKQVIFLADQRDGKPLPPEQAPYRIVVPQETKQARWVRQVTMLKVQSANE